MISDDLLYTYRKYPLMRMQDIVKLIYQGEYGAGHNGCDALVAADSLKKEIKNIKSVSFEEGLCEEISANYLRVNLRPFVALKKNIDTLRQIFIASASKNSDLKTLDKKLEIFVEQCGVRKIDLPYNSVKKFVSEYKTSGYPMLSHSMTYKLNYFPAYRVVRKDFFYLFDVINDINALQKNQTNLIIAFDGMSGSGKSTAAKVIKEIFDCNVIHTDDFFLPKEMRTAERLAKIGGNIHFERLAELLKNIKKGDEPIYERYDCKTDTFEKISLPQNRLTIVEGCYSLHPALMDNYDNAVLFKVKEDIQQKRILKRNGADMLRKFKDEWIPMENKYLKAVNFAQLPTRVLDTSDRNFFKSDF